MYPLYESWDIMLLISSYDFDPFALALAACLFLLKDDRRLTGLYIVVVNFQLTKWLHRYNGHLLTTRRPQL